MDSHLLLIAEFLYERYGEVLFDVFVEHYIEPSESWLCDYYLNDKQLDHYRDKRKQLLDRSAQICGGKEIHRRLLRQGLLGEGNKRAEELCKTLEGFVFGCLPERLLKGKSTNLDRLELTPTEEEYFINRFILSVGLIKAGRKLEESFTDNIYFPESIQKKMGFSFDFQELNKWKKRHVKWQAAAQILWFEDRESSVETIKNKLLHNPMLFELLELDALPSTNTIPDKFNGKEPSFRSLWDVITIVKPKDDYCFTCIPIVYNESDNRVHGEALYIAVSTMAKVLKSFGHSIDGIMYHEIFCHYALSDPLYPMIYSWITSSL